MSAVACELQGITYPGRPYHIACWAFPIPSELGKGLEPVIVIICEQVISWIRIACCTFHQLLNNIRRVDILVVILSILDMVLSHHLDLSMWRILFPLKIWSASTIPQHGTWLTLRKSTFFSSFCSWCLSCLIVLNVWMYVWMYMYSEYVWPG
jgi:hypothetical protein